MTTEDIVLRPGEREKYEERFWRRVNRVSNLQGCHLWTGAKKNGYGTLTFRGQPMLAHRMAWLLREGNLPGNMLVLHSCALLYDRTNDIHGLCVLHLYLGDNEQNAKDRRIARLARQARARQEDYTRAEFDLGLRDWTAETTPDTFRATIRDRCRRGLPYDQAAARWRLPIAVIEQLCSDQFA